MLSLREEARADPRVGDGAQRQVTASCSGAQPRAERQSYTLRHGGAGHGTARNCRTAGGQLTNLSKFAPHSVVMLLRLLPYEFSQCTTRLFIATVQQSVQGPTP